METTFYFILQSKQKSEE